ncbi:hypothetical protein K1719_036786 [Acacia pycnantha]|nr:hypothetical protein K1719_036786 [Acacia pycnantha]
MQRDLTQYRIKNMLQMAGDDMSSPELESLDPRYPKLRVHGHSLSSDDNWFQLADFELYTPRVNSSSVLSVTDFDVERSDLNSKNTEEESLEDSRIGNMYSKSDDNTFTDSNPADASPTPYSDSNASSPGANIATLGMTTQIDHRDEVNLELVSPALLITSTSRNLKMARSRSCKASLITNRSSFWFEKEEMIDHTPRTEIEGNFTGRPESHAQQLNYNNKAEMLPRNGSGNSVVSTSVDLHNDKSSADNGSVREDTSSNESKEKEEVNHVELNLLAADHEAPETRLGCIMIIPASSKNFGLDPTQSGDQGHLDWPSEFNRLLKEIIELWHACNVSLYHRTYFFLLIKGHPSDSIYMEVEHRRLSYLMQTFSQGRKKGENGRTVTLASSGRNVRREREMLSKQIKRRLTREERHNVYLKWGIRLSSRKRRLHLAHRLWSQTQNMDHIRESASLVAQLLGVVQPQRTLKDLFPLHSSIKHIL